MSTRTKKTASVKKACRTLSRPEGVKINGQLKKGYKYAKGGRVVKAKVTTATGRKNKAAPRRKK